MAANLRYEAEQIVLASGVADRRHRLAGLRVLHAKIETHPAIQRHAGGHVGSDHDQVRVEILSDAREGVPRIAVRVHQLQLNLHPRDALAGYRANLLAGRQLRGEHLRECGRQPRGVGAAGRIPETQDGDQSARRAERRGGHRRGRLTAAAADGQQRARADCGEDAERQRAQPGDSGADRPRCRDGDGGDRVRGFRRRPGGGSPRPMRLGAGPCSGLQPAQRVRHGVGRRPSIVGTLGEARGHHFRHGRRQLGQQVTERDGLSRQDRRHRCRRGVAQEGRTAGEHLVQDPAERKDVAPLVDRLAVEFCSGTVTAACRRSSRRQSTSRT